MRKTIALTMITALAFALVACGTDKADVNTASEPATAEATTEVTADSGADYSAEPYVTINGVDVHIGDDFAAIGDSLGEQTSYEEAKSCMGDGFDKTIGYGDYTIYSAWSETGENIYSIEIKGDAMLNSKVGCGTSVEDITAMFGEPTEGDETYSDYEFSGGDVTLSFTFGDGKVEGIEIYGQ